MPKNKNNISVVIHIPNDSARYNLSEAFNSLFAYAVKKYLDSISISSDEKRKIIKKLISELNI